MKFYFTFGSWERFPFQNTYLIVCAANKQDAKAAFRAKYPDVNEGIYNYSDMYSETEWKELCAYADREPVDIIWTDNCFGPALEGYDDLFIFVPETKQIIRISEGSGCNLLPEDTEQGYVDYIDYSQFDLDADFEEADGGMLMLKEMVRHRYKKLANAIPDVLSMAYNNTLLNAVILSENL